MKLFVAALLVLVATCAWAQDDLESDYEDVADFGTKIYTVEFLKAKNHLKCFHQINFAKFHKIVLIFVLIIYSKRFSNFKTLYFSL